MSKKERVINENQLIESRNRRTPRRPWRTCNKPVRFPRNRSTIVTINHVLNLTKADINKTIKGILTIDVKNGFNSVNWGKILSPAIDKSVPPYLSKILEDYFKNRGLVYKVEGLDIDTPLTSGVPQESIAKNRLKARHFPLPEKWLPVPSTFFAQSTSYARVTVLFRVSKPPALETNFCAVGSGSRVFSMSEVETAGTS